MGDIDMIDKIFSLKNIAVVGMSPKHHRPSNYVAMYMKNQGYKIIPVNPGHEIIQNKKCYSSLLDIPVQVDIVNILKKRNCIVDIYDPLVNKKECFKDYNVEDLIKLYEIKE